ncbi:MAG: formylmethanofuran--tetrahydromethanopterin N-formyltransferase [Candidatus Altiarchaeales archaeon WOR_SM1_86-2]|nr:MAG: formylmethanofuran--tetrahydromethanopterin N-formyltransferase [Candidatus Altiarchaeales archaeon WOR_SM1_86-2]
MEINGVEIEDTFAEAFPIKIARLLVTGATRHWAYVSANEMTGFGTSVVGCPAEAGIECYKATGNPDGRAGYLVQICHMSDKALETQLIMRVGQCAITSATAAVFNAMPEENTEKMFDTGYKERFFGDGFEKEDELAGRKIWRIPRMDGEFIVENSMGIADGVAGGNFFIMGKTQASALMAAEAAVDALWDVEGVITPFPGGIVASGSKVGSNKYSFLRASVNEKYCPTLKDNDEVESNIPEEANCVYELVINGLDEESVKEATRVGIEAACTVPGIVKISAGNYGGKLGKYKINLKDLF